MKISEVIMAMSKDDELTGRFFPNRDIQVIATVIDSGLKLTVAFTDRTKEVRIEHVLIEAIQSDQWHIEF